MMYWQLLFEQFLSSPHAVIDTLHDSDARPPRLALKVEKKEHQPRAENGGDKLMLTLRLSLIVATSSTKIYRNTVCVCFHIIRICICMYLCIYAEHFMQASVCSHSLRPF